MITGNFDLVEGWRLLWQLPKPALALVVGLFGLLFGSFCNVLIHRLPREESLWRNGSRCPRCGRAIRWFENFPLLSWLALRGRCAGCAGAISPRYPLVEAGVGLLFAWCAWRLPATPWMLIDALALALVLALAMIDLDHRLLPDDLTLPLIVLGAVAYQRPGGPGGGWMGLGLVTGLAFPLLMRWGFAALRGYEGLGLGDVKLLGALGALYGPVTLLLIVLFSAFAGVLVGPVIALCYLRHWRAQRARRGRATAPADARRAFARGLRHFRLPYGTFIALAVPPALMLTRRAAEWLLG